MDNNMAKIYSDLPGSISEIKRRNEEIGQFFFSKGAMRFFKSIIGSSVYRGCYFITSERFDMDTPRLFTVRKSMPDGSVDTFREFQEFKNSQAAKNYIKTIKETDWV